MTNVEKLALAKKYNSEVAALLKMPLRHIVFNFNFNGMRTHGRCRLKGAGLYEILISKSLVHDNDIKEVLLHELCHAYAPLRAHHGSEWKCLAKKVGDHYGITIQRCDSREHEEGHIVATLTCPCCNRVIFKMYKRCKSYYYPEDFFCTQCGKKTLGKLVLTKYK